MQYRIILLLIVLSTSCRAQNVGIRYAFPKQVDQRLREYIDKYQNVDSKKNFFIVFDKSSPSEYYLEILPMENAPMEPTDSLLKKTNRYVKVGDHTIPILFLTDTNFLFIGEDDRGRQKRVAVLYHGYGIRFTYDGEILEANK